MTKSLLVERIANGGMKTRGQLVEETGLGKSWVSKLLNELVSEGKLIAEGSTRNRVYKLTDVQEED